MPASCAASTCSCSTTRASTTVTHRVQRREHRRHADEAVRRRRGEEQVAERVADADRDTIAERRAARDATAGARARRRRRAISMNAVVRKIERRPPRVGLARGVHRREVEAEADRGEQRQPHARGDAPVAAPGARCAASATPTSATRSPRAGTPTACRRSRCPKTTGTIADDARDRRDDAHRRRSACRGSRRRARASPRPPRDSRAAPPVVGRLAADQRRAIAIATRPPICAPRAPRSVPSVRACNGPKKSATPQARLAPSASRTAARLVRDGPRRRDRVELVRVVEHRRLGGPRRAGVVVHRDACSSSARCAPSSPSACSSISAQAEVDVAEQPPLLGRRERRRRAPSSSVRPTSWTSAAASEQVAAQPRMELRRLAAERRHADGVLEQAAGVGVVVVRRRRERARGRVAEHARDRRRAARDATSRGEELEEALQLVGVAAQRRA